jgi:hypothetical protein
MVLPVNKKTQNCVPVSSNCVIWQGPDIECIQLCKGDSISVVVAALADNLCSIMTSLNINNYDLSCFNIGSCGPKDFASLIQFLINKICELENIEIPTGTGTNTDALNYVVTIAPAFYYTNPEGDIVKTMTLLNYVIAIGNKVNTIVGQITSINNSLTNHEGRIQALEDAPAPTLTLPSLTPSCIGTTPLRLDIFLQTLETEFCELRSFTGNPAAIADAMNAICLGLNTTPKLYGSGNMDGITGWYSTPTSMAESFANLWRTVCDMRSAVTYVLANCCPSGAAAINLVLDSVLANSTTVNITFNGTVANTIIDSPTGSTVRISDGLGGVKIVNAVMINTNHVLTGQPLSVDVTGLNTSVNLTVDVTGNFTDSLTGSTYVIPLTDVIAGSTTCPIVSIVPAHTTADWSFTYNNGPAVIIVRVKNNYGTIVGETVLNVTTPNQSGVFTNLVAGTNHTLQLIVNGLDCTVQTFTTDAYVCNVPSILTPVIDDTNAEGDTDGSTIAAWIVEYNSFHP